MKVHENGTIKDTETGEVTLTNEGTLSLRPYQRDAVDAFYKQLNEGHLSGVISAPTGCHEKNHPILMYDGTIKFVQSIRIGDEIMGADGKARIVKKLHRGKSRMIMITPNNEKSFVVNEGHIFRFAYEHVQFNSTICDNVNLCYNDKELEFDFPLRDWRINPYDVGLLVSGKRDINTKELTSKDLRSFEKLIDSMELWKHIPDEYKQTTVKARYELLAGIMDGFMSNEIPLLTDDVTFIARSLGFKVISVPEGVKILGKLSKIPTKRIKFSDIECDNEISFRYQYIEEQDYYGFEIDGDHLYLDGNFMIHHNSGKSIMIAEITRKFADEGKNVLIITHRKELIEQDDALFRKHCPNIKTGIISAMIKRKEFDKQVTFGGIMTVIRNLDKLPKIDLLLIDEVHRVSTESTTSYFKTIQHLKNKNPNIIIVGFSATPYRMGHGLLYEGDDRLFDCLYYDIGIGELIQQGYLCDVISRGSKLNIDLSKVHTKMGDYDSKELEKAANNKELTEHAVEQIRKLTYDRHAIIVFCCGVEHAKTVKDSMIKHGIETEVLTGKTKVEERERIIQDFKNGKIKCVVNVGVLTEGFDYTGIDCVSLLTSTKSTNKYVQMIGRGMRLHEGKQNCLLLDFGHNVEYHGFIDAVIPPDQQTETKGKRSTVKKCPKCYTYLPINASKCKNCGYEYPKMAMAVNHDYRSYNGSLFSANKYSNSKTGWKKVEAVEYNIHQKDGKPRTYRCTYRLNDGQLVSKYLSLDNGANSFAKRKSVEYIKLLGGTAESIESAQIESKLWRIPSELFIKQNGKYYDIERMKIKKN